MANWFRGALGRLLQLPAEPQAPPGERDSVRIFRASPNFYRYNFVRWCLAQSSALAGLLFGLFLLRVLPQHLPAQFGGFFGWFVYAEIAAWAGFLLQFPLTFAMLRLDYENRWYIVSRRSLRIREGLHTVREQTLTFANVQNMTIRQGPLQRILAIGDLEVHTAGGGSAAEGKDGGPKDTHVAIFRGVGNAAEIRSAIRERVRRYRDAGLGDPDDADSSEEEASVVGASELLNAGRELAREARLLRLATAARIASS